MLAGPAALLLLATSSFVAASSALSVISFANGTGADHHELSARSLSKRATTYAYGNTYTLGALSKTVLFQSSGIFAKMGGNSCVPKYKITTCYMIYLGASGMTQSTTTTGSLSTIVAAALADDGDLGAYYTVFPDQAYAFADYADGALEQRRRRSYYEETPEEVGARVRRQLVITCGATGPVTASSTTSTKTTSTKTTTTTTSAAATTTAAVTARQRIELFSWPGARMTTSWKYTWRSHLVSGTSVTDHFFHLWQILRRDACGGPVITLDARTWGGEEVIAISDLGKGRACTACVTLPLSKWTDHTIINTIYVTWGSSGNFTYTAAYQARPTIPVLSYQAFGDMGAQSSIKYGMYRLQVDGQKEARSFVGDYSAEQLHPGDYQP